MTVNNKRKIRIVDIITISITVIIFLYTLFNDSKIKEIEHILNSIEHKPILELIAKPKISIEKIFFNEKDYIGYPYVDSIVIGIDIEIKQIIKFKNIGNDKAQIILRLLTDTTTGKDYIREILLDEDRFLEKSSPSLSDDFFVDIELFPGDTFTFEDSRKIGMDLITKDYVSHFLVMYNNSLNNTYDTYIKSRFKLNQPLFELVTNPKSGEIGFRILKETTSGFFELEIIPNRTTKVYSKKETKKMYKLFELIAN